MSDPVLDVRGLDAGYGPMQILFGIDLHVDHGEQVLVFGPNGAGKSTLMKALVGLLVPSRGSITVLGRNLTGQPPERIVQSGLGYVPQIENVFASLTIEENLEMGALSIKRNRRARIDAMYERFPVLATKRTRNAGTLSGGQRQLLAMARALIMQPEILLLDEPTAGLAPQMVGEVFAMVQQISAAGTAILMVEQNAKQALEYVDRAYVLENGHVRFEDQADRLLQNEDIGKLYLGARGDDP